MSISLFFLPSSFLIIFNPLYFFISFQVSVLFDYIPTPSSLFSPANPVDQNSSPSNKSIGNADLKLIETDDNSSIIIGPANKLIEKDELKQNHKSNDKMTEVKGNSVDSNENRRSASSNRRAFALYPNCVSDWDSTDSESGLPDNSNNDETET